MKIKNIILKWLKEETQTNSLEFKEVEDSNVFSFLIKINPNAPTISMIKKSDDNSIIIFNRFLPKGLELSDIRISKNFIWDYSIALSNLNIESQYDFDKYILKSAVFYKQLYIDDLTKTVLFNAISEVVKATFLSIYFINKYYSQEIQWQDEFSKLDQVLKEIKEIFEIREYWSLCYDDDGHPSHENKLQRLIWPLLETKIQDIGVIAKEPDTGFGKVDFSLFGTDFTCSIEIKKDKTWRDGFKQLRHYIKGHKSDLGILVIFDYQKNRIKESELGKESSAIIKDLGVEVKVIIIDVSKKQMASS